MPSRSPPTTDRRVIIDPHPRLSRVAAWFLAVSYGVGAPLGAYFEFSRAALSDRFDLPAWLIYLSSVLQLVCAPLIVSRRYRRLAAALLTLTTIGAAGSHVRIGAPLTAIPALVFSAIQIWVGLLPKLGQE